MSEYQAWYGDLAAYNAGYLVGEWIDMTLDRKDIEEKIQEILKEGEELCGDETGGHHEEWFIADWEGFEGCQYMSIDEIKEQVEFLQEYPDFAELLLKEYSNNQDEARRIAENHLGSYENKGDYARDYLSQVENNDFVNRYGFYIDFEKLERDMEWSGDIVVLGSNSDGFYVFDNY